MKRTEAAWFLLGGVCPWLAAAPLVAAELDQPKELAGGSLRVAAVQMRSSRDLSDNTARVEKFIRECANRGARAVVFPECALTGYFEDTVSKLSAAAITQAVERVSAACRAANVYAVIGTAFRDGARLFDSALIIAPTGRVLARYDKIQLAESWPESGEHLLVFNLDRVPCSVIICHDERYPELVRLPVLAGAQVIFYLSHESGLQEERKIGPYRAQIQARAVENHVYLVQANAPANPDRSGSHGHSRIIAPDGNLVQEASVFDEDVLIARLELRKATRQNAKGSLTRGPLRDWWNEGLKRVRVID